MYFICTTGPRIFAYSSGLGKFLQPFPVFWCVFLSSICCLRLSRWLPRLFARVLPTPATHHAPLPSWLRRPFFAPTTQRNESRRIRNYRCNLLMQPEDPTKGYLTIISLVRVGCEMEDSQRASHIQQARVEKKRPQNIENSSRRYF